LYLLCSICHIRIKNSKSLFIESIYFKLPSHDIMVNNIKGLFRSKSITTLTFPLFLSSIHLSIMLTKAVWQEWFDIKPDWASCRRLYFAKYWYICLEICFSITLDIMGSTDVGLWFVGKHFTPEIKIGDTFAFFNMFGYIPLSSILLNI
jgi:hypothetical protein